MKRQQKRDPKNIIEQFVEDTALVQALVDRFDCDPSVASWLVAERRENLRLDPPGDKEEVRALLEDAALRSFLIKECHWSPKDADRCLRRISTAREKISDSEKLRN